MQSTTVTLAVCICEHWNYFSVRHRQQLDALRSGPKLEGLREGDDSVALRSVFLALRMRESDLPGLQNTGIMRGYCRWD